jgi:tetratricopeptide (TPR) repeat protein
MDTKKRQFMSSHGQPVRDAAFYDRTVRERSPYTGMLSLPRTAVAADVPFDIAENDAIESVLPPTRRIHLVIAALIVVLSGAIALAAINTYGEAEEAEVAVTVEKDKTPAPEASEPSAAVRPPPADSLAAQPAVLPDTAAGTARESLPSYEEMLKAAAKGPAAKRAERLREAIAVYPERDEAMARLSLMLMERRNARDEALTLAIRAAELNPGNAMAWLVIGYIHQMSGNARRAREAYVKCANAEGPKKFARDCKHLI